MSADVLVVDDHLPTASKVARLIEAQTGLRAIPADDPDAALELLAKNAIKVVVLDQRMPQLPGTKLIRKLRERDGSIKSVLLTGKASADELGEAIPVKFDNFVKKANVSEVPDIVFDLYLEYLQGAASTLNRDAGKIVASSRRYLIFGPRTEYSVAAIEILDREFLLDTEWETVLKIDAGEERKYSEQQMSTSKFSIEKQSQEQLTSSLSASLPLKNFSLKLEDVVMSMLKTSHEETVQTTTTVERTYKLPAEPSEKSVLHIRARHFQTADVYSRVLVRISRSCRSCKMSTLIPIVVLCPTGKISSRHVDYWSNNTKEVTYTGIS